MHLFLQYVLLLLHIIFKFSFHSWQVPRSSVGRALYRECGPSQDGDPVPGDFPFCFVFFFFSLLFLFQLFFRSFVAIPMLYQSKMLDGVSVGFPPLISKFTLSKCTLKSRTCNGTLLDFFLFFFL